MLMKICNLLKKSGYYYWSIPLNINPLKVISLHTEFSQEGYITPPLPNSFDTYISQTEKKPTFVTFDTRNIPTNHNTYSIIKNETSGVIDLQQYASIYIPITDFKSWLYTIDAAKNASYFRQTVRCIASKKILPQYASRSSENKLNSGDFAIYAHSISLNTYIRWATHSMSYGPITNYDPETRIKTINSQERSSLFLRDSNNNWMSPNDIDELWVVLSLNLCGDFGSYSYGDVTRNYDTWLEYQSYDSLICRCISL